MKLSELELVRQLLIESYQEYEEKFEQDRWERYMEELTASVDNEKIDRLYIAKYKDDIVGTMQLFRSAKEAYQVSDLEIDAPIIRFLAVHPRGRGEGTARKLLDKAICYAKKQNAQAVFLHSTELMSQAIKLYIKYGFVREPAKDYIKHGNVIQCYSIKLDKGKIKK